MCPRRLEIAQRQLSTALRAPLGSPATPARSGALVVCPHCLAAACQGCIARQATRKPSKAALNGGCGTSKRAAAAGRHPSCGMLPGANASSALGGAEAVDAPVFVSEDAYAALSLSARWLRRAPAVAGAARQDTRDAGEAGAPVRAPQPRAYTARAALPRADASAQCHSSLTWEEHAWYLRACLPDVAARLTPEELERVRQLAGVVAAEQAAYVQERVASAADEEALRYFHPDVAAQARAAARVRGAPARR
jgi:hypothetical protein